MHRDVYVYYTSIHLCSPNSIPKANVRNSNPLSPEGATFRHSKYHLNQRSHVCICTAQESHSLKKHTRVWCNHYKLPSFLVLQALHRNILQLSYRSSCALRTTSYWGLLQERRLRWNWYCNMFYHTLSFTVCGIKVWPGKPWKYSHDGCCCHRAPVIHDRQIDR